MLNTLIESDIAAFDVIMMAIIVLDIIIILVDYLMQLEFNNYCFIIEIIFE